MTNSTPTENLKWHPSTVSTEQREARNKHKGCTVWLTGLPGSGKSTVAQEVESLLFAQGFSTFTLDGDNIRHGLCSDLGFSPADRTENIRRIGEVARLFADAGIITLVAFVSPYRSDREVAKAAIGSSRFLEIHCACPIEICEKRDPKGHYAKARQGVIPSFTGVSAPYEEPLKPALKLATHLESPQTSAMKVVELLTLSGILSTPDLSALIHDHQ